MSTTFDFIVEDFLADLEAITDLVELVAREGRSSKSRIASINSATLLLAATFEEFIRDMGRQFAREFVSRTERVTDLPPKLTATVWKQALNEIARVKIELAATTPPLLHIATEARFEFESICKFFEGDTSQDIYKHVAHNQNNMKSDKINSIFKVFNIKNICSNISSRDLIKLHFCEQDAKKSHLKFINGIDRFMEKRNGIAHSLNPGSSAGVESFIADIELLRVTAQALAEALPHDLPSTYTRRSIES